MKEIALNSHCASPVLDLDGQSILMSLPTEFRSRGKAIAMYHSQLRGGSVYKRGRGRVLENRDGWMALTGKCINLMR